MIRHAPLAHHTAQYALCGGCRPALPDAYFGHAKQFRKIGSIGEKKKPRREPGQRLVLTPLANVS